MQECSWYSDHPWDLCISRSGNDVIRIKRSKRRGQKMAFARTDPEHICLDKTDRLSRVRGDDAVYSEPAVVMEEGADETRIKRDTGEREKERLDIHLDVGKQKLNEVTRRRGPCHRLRPLEQKTLRSLSGFFMKSERRRQMVVYQNDILPVSIAIPNAVRLSRLVRRTSDRICRKEEFRRNIMFRASTSKYRLVDR